MIEAWIFALPAEWDALEPFSYTYSQAVTGYWNDSGAYRVYNVVGTEVEIQDIVDALTDVQQVFSWIQGPGVDNLEKWPTTPADILAVMKDHVTYDENGDVVDTTPATLENPNWGHVFLGQSERIFAGRFNTDFNEDFR